MMLSWIKWFYLFFLPLSLINPSICNTAQWGTGTVCYQRLAPACAARQRDLCTAAANRCSALYCKLALRLHPAAVWGVGATLWEPGALLSGVQCVHWAFQGLWLRGVHEERLCGQGQVGAIGQAARLPHAVRPLDWGGLPHVPTAAL